MNYKRVQIQSIKALFNPEILMHFKNIFRCLTRKFSSQILNLLEEEGELNVTDIQTKLNLDQSFTSINLRELRKSKLVTWRREGKFIFYSINEDTNKLLKDLVQRICDVLHDQGDQDEIFDKTIYIKELLMFLTKKSTKKIGKVLTTDDDMTVKQISVKARLEHPEASLIVCVFESYNLVSKRRVKKNIHSTLDKNKVLKLNLLFADFYKELV